MYFMGCFPFGSGPSHPEPHCWNKFIENSEFSRERSSLDPPTPRNFLTFLNLLPKFSATGPKFASVQKFSATGPKFASVQKFSTYCLSSSTVVFGRSNAAPKCISLKSSYARA